MSKSGIPDDSLFGVIRFEVDKVSTLDREGRYSSEVEVGGVPWKAKVYKQLGEGEWFVGLVLCGLKDASKSWSIHVEAAYSILNSDASKTVTTKGRRYIFRYNATRYGIQQFLKGKTMMDKEKGFIKDDTIMVEIRILITNMKGIKTARVDFSNPDVKCHDVALILDGEKIYVNKGILAVNSAFFSTLFYGDFAEKNKNEIELKDINREEFIELLHVIYPHPKRISDNSVEYLLKLADRFEISCVTERVEEYLIDSDDISVIEKLRLSEEYRLFNLMNHCLSK